MRCVSQTAAGFITGPARSVCRGGSVFCVCCQLTVPGPANEGTTFSPCRQSSVPVAGNGERMVAFSRKNKAYWYNCGCTWMFLQVPHAVTHCSWFFDVFRIQVMCRFGQLSSRLICSARRLLKLLFYRAAGSVAIPSDSGCFFTCEVAPAARPIAVSARDLPL